MSRGECHLEWTVLKYCSPGGAACAHVVRFSARTGVVSPVVLLLLHRCRFHGFERIKLYESRAPSPDTKDEGKPCAHASGLL